MSKNNIFRRIIGTVIPLKGDRISDVIRKIILIIALAVFIVSGIYLVNYYSVGTKNSALLEEARSLYEKTNPDKDKNGMFLKFSELYKKNNDLKGWVSIDGTTVDYPVYQAKDNDYYIEHDMSKNESRYGAVFADYTTTIDKIGNSKNVVLYGHNMIDGSMFSELINYQSLDFYKKHPIVKFDTLYNEGSYKIFAVIVTNSREEDDSGYVFNYMQTSFSSDKSYENFLRNVNIRSVINTGIDVTTSDEIITMSTCSYEFDNARTVVFARKFRDKESMYINTSAAKKNPAPVYPEAYYKKHGGKKPEVDLKDLNRQENENNAGDTSSGVSSGNDASNTSSTSSTAESAIKVKVDNYVGLSLFEAIDRLSDKGFIIGDVKYLDDGEKFNTVTKQNFAPGEKVPYGSSIYLEATGKFTTVKMPNFKKYTVDEAKKIGKSKGITVSVMYVTDKKPKGTVLSQNPKKGKISDTNTVILYASSGRSVVPKIVGLSEKKAIEKLKKQGFKKHKIKYVETDKKSEIGKVIKQSIKAKKYGNVDDAFKFTVGKKKEPEKEKTDEKDKKSGTSSAKTDDNTKDRTENNKKKSQKR